MIRYRIISVLFVFLICLSSSALHAGQPSEEEINNVLSKAESLFKAMQEKQYPEIWTMITEKTKNQIINSTFKELKKSGNPIQREKIESDFEHGEAISKAYWDGYLLMFDPQLVLEHSKWTIGMIGNGEAEINIHYKKSPNPAVLQLFRENETWKVGLHETFGGRSLLLY